MPRTRRSGSHLRKRANAAFAVFVGVTETKFCNGTFASGSSLELTYSDQGVEKVVRITTETDGNGDITSTIDADVDLKISSQETTSCSRTGPRRGT